jgi:hypothetical protein
MRLLRVLAAMVAALSIFPWSGAAFAATPDKSYFFATREACAAAFRKRECDAAFANAEAELRDRAPSFDSRSECRLKYHFCEARRIEPLDAEETEAIAYSPLALGVEMVAAARGVVAAPVLAVETPPSLFPRYPVAREYVARMKEPPRDEALAYNAILPADRFAPFPKNSAAGAIASFVPVAPSAADDAPLTVASQEETPQERRARLRNAPFVE